LKNQFFNKLDYNPSKIEITSWKNSLEALSNILDYEIFMDSYIFLEFQMPLSSARCDVILVGKGKDGNENAVIIENKQWDNCEKSEIEDSVLVRNDQTHPSAQVRNYCEYLKYYHEAFNKFGLKIFGCAFLHNLSDDDSINILKSEEYFDRLPINYPIFTKKDFDNFKIYLEDKLGKGEGEIVSKSIKSGKLCPSTKLLDVVANAIQWNFEWRLLDEQILIFNTIISKVKIALESSGKYVIIVKGGPGTGKSILAIQLLAFAAREHWRVAHATGSKAFITNLKALTEKFAKKYLKNTYNARYLNQIPVEHIFSTFANIAKIGKDKKNELDLVVADESHRIWDFRRTLFQNYNKKLSDVPMVEEVINASRVTAFFLDDNQNVRANEIGSVEYIKKHAENMGATVSVLYLNIQFRCSGNEGYINWIEYLMGYINLRLLFTLPFCKELINFISRTINWILHFPIRT